MSRPIPMNSNRATATIAAIEKPTIAPLAMTAAPNPIVATSPTIITSTGHAYAFARTER